MIELSNEALAALDFARAMVAGQRGEQTNGDAPTARKIRAFYNSWQWKRLRYQFLKDKKRACECCGTTPADGARIVVDHVKPVRHFWHLRLDPKNLQLLCDGCNRGKGSRDETDFRNTEEA